MPPIRLLPGLLLTLVVSSSVACAQLNGARKDIDSPGLVIEVVAGWNGYSDQTEAFPISFLIRNDSERNFEGVLSLQESSNGMEISLGEIVVAPNSTRRVTAIRSMNGWIDCSAQLRRGRQILWQRNVDLHSGKAFDINTNYAIFVDGGARRLELTTVVADSTIKSNYDYHPAGSEGRPVECISAKPWQIPNHPGPLFVAQALIFAEGASEKDLNQVQWNAIAEWMCQGGVVFVQKGSRDIIDRLTEFSPMRTEPSVEAGPFQILRFGTGAIYEYGPRLMTSDADEIRKSISGVAGSRPKFYLGGLSNWSYTLTRPDDNQAERNRLLIIGLFVCYGLITGLGAIFLLRFSQRVIAIFTIVMVTLASLMAAMVGGYLRLSKGDLTLISVTQAGVGGMIQVADIRARSAGGRNTNVYVQGERADLQYIGIARDQNAYYYGYGPSRLSGFPSFDWQPSHEPNETDRYHIQIPMSPWGRRQCLATAFKRESERVNVELKFEPAAATSESVPDPGPTISRLAGKLSVKLENRLPFVLTDCSLYIGATIDSPPDNTPANRNRNPYRRNMHDDESRPVDGMIDVYMQQRLQDVGPGQTTETQVPTNFNRIQSWTTLNDLQIRFSQSPFRLSQMGTSNAWLIARMKRSPIIEFDEQHSDFVLQQDIHLFIQELSPDEIPDALKYSPTAKPPVTVSEEPVEQ